MQELKLQIEQKPELKNVYIVSFEGAFDGSVKEPLVELEKLIQN